MNEYGNYKKQSSIQLRGNRLATAISAFISIFISSLPLLTICTYISYKFGLLMNLPWDLIIPAIVYWFIMWSCFNVGLCKQYLAVRDSKDYGILTPFYGFMISFKSIIVSIFSMVCVVLGLVLFIFPGILVASRLWAAPYVLADNNKAGVIKAIKTSLNITKGKTNSVISLGISYIVWIVFPFALVLLCTLLLLYSTYSLMRASTVSINIDIFFNFIIVFFVAFALVIMIYAAFLLPRIGTAYANLYEDLKNKK